MTTEKTKELIYPTLTSPSGEVMRLEVCRSGAGFYLGYMSTQEGPFHRESTYLATQEEADNLLIDWVVAFTQQQERTG